jgi:hypothetical protein
MQRELEAQGVRVVCPQLPNADVPKIDEWVPALERLVTSKPEETLIVAHSLSVPAVLMYLERLQKEAQFAQIIFVGGVYRAIMGLVGEEEGVARPWLTHVYDAEQIREVAPRIEGFFSTDDPCIPVATAEDMQRDFGVVPSIEQGMGHYNGAEYPQFMSAISKLL